MSPPRSAEPKTGGFANIGPVVAKRLTDVRIFVSLDHRVRKEYSIAGIAKGMNRFEDISVVQNANY